MMNNSNNDIKDDNEAAVVHDEGEQGEVGGGVKRCSNDNNKENSITTTTTTANNNNNIVEKEEEEEEGNHNHNHNNQLQKRKKILLQMMNQEEDEEAEVVSNKEHQQQQRQQLKQEQQQQEEEEQQQQQQPKIKVFFGGELFNSRDLIGNLFLVEAIDKISKHHKYSFDNIYLAQNQCNQNVTHQNIKDKDTLGVLNSDIAIFAFEGTELDSGTVVEYIQAKTVDIPCVVYRTDIRGGSGEESIDKKCNKWNLMVSFYPRTKIVYISSIINYQKIYNLNLQQQQQQQVIVCSGDEEEKKMSDDGDYEAISSTKEEMSSLSLQSQIPKANIVAMKYSEYIAQILIDAMDEVLMTKPILSKKEKNHMKQQCIQLWGINPNEISDSPYLM